MAAYTDPHASQTASAASARFKGAAGVPVPVYAALDLGTNNCRLLIARPARNGFRVVDAFSRIVRLGEGMSPDGCLAEDAIDRTLDALRVCAAKMARRGVTVARHVATEACRRAANGAEFLYRVHRETGIQLEIISADEEARLALSGCASLLHGDTPYALVLDIGGGSTELIWLAVEPGGRPKMIDYLSLPIGVVTFAEKYGRDRIGEESYSRMIETVMESLQSFDRQHGIGQEIACKKVQMLGTSGTVTTLAGILLDLPRYDRDRVDGSYLDFSDIAAISARLAGEDFAARSARPCIGRERADLVVAGAAILEGICRLWPVGRLRVADRGLREGILLGLMDRTAQEA